MQKSKIAHSLAEQQCKKFKYIDPQGPREMNKYIWYFYFLSLSHNNLQ